MNCPAVPPPRLPWGPGVSWNTMPRNRHPERPSPSRAAAQAVAACDYMPVRRSPTVELGTAVGYLAECGLRFSLNERRGGLAHHLPVGADGTGIDQLKVTHRLLNVLSPKTIGPSLPGNHGTSCKAGIMPTMPATRRRSRAGGKCLVLQRPLPAREELNVPASEAAGWNHPFRRNYRSGAILPR